MLYPYYYHLSMTHGEFTLGASHVPAVRTDDHPGVGLGDEAPGTLPREHYSIRGFKGAPLKPLGHHV